MTLIRMGCAILLALGLALILAPTSATAAESGEIVALRGGTLERLERGVWREIVVHAAVRTGDRLRTGKGAVAVIAFPVLGRFVMGPGAEIELGREPKDFTTQVDRGALWLRTTPSAGSRAALSSPYAIAGVRGTAFSMLYSADGKTVCACTCSGSVEVQTPDGAKVQVARGQYVAIDAGASAPVAAQSSLDLLEQRGTVFDFCQSCHVAGGKGKLRPDWRGGYP